MRGDLTLDLAAAERCRRLLWQRIRSMDSGWFARRRRAALEHEALLLDVVVESLRHGKGPAAVVVPAGTLPTVHALHRSSEQPERAHVDDERGSVLGWTQAVVTLVAVAVVVLRWIAHGGDASVRTWLFLDDVEHVSALGFEPGDARAGAWRLEHHEGATGRRALVNHQGDADAPPATVVWNGRAAADVLVRTRCAVAGTGVEQACGVVFGWQSPRDHLVARVDVATRSLAVAIVERGVERLLGTAPIGDVDASWHELVVTTQGDRISVRHHAGATIELVDEVAVRRGGVGLWAPAASTAYFDELLVQPLHPLAARS